MPIRKPAVAGRFYPEHAPTLRRTIERHLAEATSEPAPDAVQAIIAPHAGYPYSGLTAAHAFKRLYGKAVRRVILLGCSHHHQFEGPSIFSKGAYETPLGVVPVDEELAGALVSDFGSTCSQAHSGEHSLEVQLPFLQMVLQGEFQLVPILFGAAPSEFHQRFGAALADYLTPEDLVLASTDLSHFLPESQANAMDKRSLNQVLKRDASALQNKAAAGRCSLCGVTAVVTAMAYANATNTTQWQLLDYRTSAWASGDTRRVVGYGAITMERQVA